MKTLPIALACAAVAFAQSAEKPGISAEAIAPSLLYRVEPEYGAEARAKALEGVTTLYAEINREGNVANVKVIHSLDPGLDAAAIAAVKLWRFRPGMRSGKPVTVAATIEVRFQLPRYPVLPSGAPRPQVPEVDSGWLDILKLLDMISSQ